MDTPEVAYQFEKLGEIKALERRRWTGKVHQIWRYRWYNGVRLKNADDSLNVNWVELLITAEDGTQRFRIAFITSHLVTEENVEEVVQAGRTVGRSRTRTSTL